MKVIIKVSSACDLCGRCVECCPTGVFHIADARLNVNQESCIYCKGCEVICPVKAIEVHALNEGLVITRRKTLVSIK